MKKTKGKVKDYIIVKKNNELAREITAMLKPDLQSMVPKHMLLVGLPGTGKTGLIRKIFNDYEETANLIIAPVDCVKDNTSQAVIKSILTTVSGKKLSHKHSSLFSLYKRLGNLLAKRYKILIVFLDNINRMQTDEDVNDTISRLLILNRDNPDVYICIHAAINDIHYDIHNVLDDSVNALFQHDTTDFPPYTEYMMFEILKDYAKDVLNPGVISEQQIQDITAVTFLFSDLRVGHCLFQQSALLAGKAGKNTIEDTDIRESIAELKQEYQYYLLNALQPHEPVAPPNNDVITQRMRAITRPDYQIHDDNKLPNMLTARGLYQNLSGGDESVLSPAEFCDIVCHLRSLQCIDTRIHRLPTGQEIVEIVSLEPDKNIMEMFKGKSDTIYR